MERLDLVKYLAESAAELLDREPTSEHMDEAAELLNLGARMLARADASAAATELQEAA